jgi:hypothetical protein
MENLRTSLRTGGIKMNAQQRDSIVSFKDVQTEESKESIVPINSNANIDTYVDFEGFEDITKEEAKEADGVWTKELFNQSF